MTALRGIIASIAVLLISCSTQVDPSNPYDPDTPEDQQKTSSLRGSVSGAVPNGDPVAMEGAQVLLSGPTQPSNNPQTTGEDGGFNFGDLIPGFYDLEVTHPGYFRQVRQVMLQPGVDRDVQVVLDSGVDPEEQAHVTGVAHMSSELERPTGEQDHSGILVEVDGAGIRTVTNSEGEFDLHLAADSYQLLFSAPNHVRAERNVLALAGQTVTVPDSPVVLLPNPATLTGLVMRRTCEPDPADEVVLPAEGAQVVLVGTSHSGDVDSLGQFSITGIPAGLYSLRASLDEYDPREVTPILLRGGELFELAEEITLPAAKGSVTGKVLLAGESDHSGTVVHLTGTGFIGLTAADGTFRIEGVCAGTGYEIRASHERFLTQSVGGVSIPAGGTTVIPDLELARKLGGLVLNGGNDFTSTLTVSYDLSAPAGTTSMRMSEDQSALPGLAWEPFAQQGTFDLTAAEGSRTVYAQFSDGTTPSGILDDSVILDQTAPIDPDLTIEDGEEYSNDPDGALLLTLTASEVPAPGVDAVSGLAWMRLINHDLQDPTATAPSDPDDPAWLAVAPEPYRRTIDHPLLRPATDEQKEIWVRFADSASNWSDPVAARVTLDRQAPDGTSVAVSDATLNGFVRSERVNLDLTATDENPGLRMRLSNNDGFIGAAWLEFGPQAVWFLNPGEGERTVWAQFKDAAGNVTADSVSSTVTVDFTPPGSPTVSIDEGLTISDPDINLTLSAVDASEMRLVIKNVDGSSIFQVPEWEPYATSRALTLPAGQQGQKCVEASFRDEAGNTSYTAIACTLYDTELPTGTLQISGGDQYTGSTGVTLNLTGFDPGGSGVTGVKLANAQSDLDAAAVLPFEPTKVWTLSPPSGPDVEETKEVWARIVDRAGNQSADLTDDIILDTQAPTGTIQIPGLVNGRTSDRVIPVDLTFSADTASMKLSSGDQCAGGNWVEASTETVWTLSDIEGQQWVSVRFRDAVGQESSCYPVSVTLDTTGPSPGSFTLTGNAGAESGYTNSPDLLVNAASSDSDCQRAEFAEDISFNVLTHGENSCLLADVAYTLQATNNEWKDVYLRFLDDLGNVGPATVASIVLDQEGPVVIGNGYTVEEGTPTNQTTLNLTMQVVGADQMEVTENTCTQTWAAYAPTHQMVFDPATNEVKTLAVQFRDWADNRTACLTSTVNIDTQDPTVAFSLEGVEGRADKTANRAIQLTIDLASNDADRMRISNQSDMLDSSFVPIVVGTPVAWTLSASSGSKTVYLEVMDQAGNVSSRENQTIDLDQVAPGVPNLQVFDIDGDGFPLSASEVELRWNNPGDPDQNGFTLQRFVQGEDNFSDRADLNPATFEYTDTVDEPGKIHYYRISARDDLGNVSAWSNLASAHPFEPIQGVYWIQQSTSIRHDLAPHTGTFRLGAHYLRQDASGTIFTDVLVDNLPFFAGSGAAGLDFRWDEGLKLFTSNQDNSLVYESTIPLRLDYREHIDTLGDVGNRCSIGVDGQGHVHISYLDATNQNLKYVSNAAGTWTAASLDAVGPLVDDSVTSLGVDSNDRVHIAYYDNSAGTQDLRYANNTAGSWQNWAVDTAGNVGRKPALAIDGNNRIHISHGQSITWQIRYSTNASGSWVTVPAVSADASAYSETSIGIDSSGFVHIAYQHPVERSLWHATDASGSWEKEQVDDDLDGTIRYGRKNSMFVDAYDKIHITYWEEFDGGLRYSVGGWGSWDSRDIDANSSTGSQSSIVVDRKGEAYITYHDDANLALKYAQEDGVGGVRDNLDTVGAVGAWSSVALDPDGDLHVAYYDETLGGDLKYARLRRGSKTLAEDVSTGDDSGIDLDEVGRHTSIDVDADGYAHISYHRMQRGGGHQLRYSTNRSGDWAEEVVAVGAGNNPFGSYSSLGLDSNGFVHISCTNDTWANLNYADNTGGFWNTESVGPASGAGAYTSLAIDSSDNIHISYVSDTNLMYASGSSGSWSTTPVGIGGNYQHTSLDLDGSGRAHISFYDSTSGDLKYANNAGAWTVATIDAVGDVGQYSSLEVDGSGHVHIAYYDATNWVLKYATNASGSWEITSLDSESGVGKYCSLDIDAGGRAHISFYDFLQHDLKYASNLSGLWTTSALDEFNDMGQYASIRVGPRGKVHISYYYATDGDLRYASGMLHGYLPATSIVMVEPF